MKVAEDQYTEDELMQANNDGQEDRARYEDSLAHSVIDTAIRQMFQDDFYNPPHDPVLKEHYDAGFHNR